jgi:hypothetical protein
MDLHICKPQLAQSTTDNLENVPKGSRTLHALHMRLTPITMREALVGNHIHNNARFLLEGARLTLTV